MSAWGLEARFPFLDHRFMNFVMNINVGDKLPQTPRYCNIDYFHNNNVKKAQFRKNIEKCILREAFSSYSPEYIPNVVLWRQKEQFSDGVGYDWVNTLKKIGTKNGVYNVNEEELANQFGRIPTCEEQGVYMTIFANLFPHKKQTMRIGQLSGTWTPNWNANNDPSGRVIDVHNES